MTQITICKSSMALRKPPGRPPAGKNSGSAKLPPVYASDEFVELVNVEVERLGIGFSEFGRSAFEFYINHLREDTTNEIRFKLNNKDKAELEKLADSVYHDDVNMFVKSLTRAALDNGPEAVRKLIYGRLDEEVEERMKADEEQTASAKTKTQKAA